MKEGNIIEKLRKVKDKNYFEAWQLGLENRDLKPFVRLGLVEIVYKSSKHTTYRINKEMFERYEKLVTTDIKLEGKLFENIYNHEKHKELILKALEKKVSTLLVGSPATAKTLFLLELRKLPNSIYLTSDITKAGLQALISVTNPRLLLIDQLDNIKDKFVYSLLLDLLEYGITTKVSYNIQELSKYKITVIATANSTKRIPEALLSRFLIVKFKRYTESEYEKVARSILYKITSKELADYIIEKTKDYRDIRNAIRLAKICKTKEDVDKFSELIRFSK